MANQLISGTGSFVPLTNVWDVQRLQSVDINSAEFKELLVRLYQNINNIAISLNTKDAAYYPLSEFLNGQLFFPNPNLDSTTPQTPTNRQAFRTVVNFGALPNATTKSVAHNIDINTVLPTTYSFTRIYGATSNPNQTSFLPLPYASTTLINNIQLQVTNTNIVITTGIDYSAYTLTYIIVEYIKN